MLVCLAVQVEAAGERRGVQSPGRPGCMSGEPDHEEGQREGQSPMVLLQAWLRGLRSLKGWS